jgi:hypothetical protein
MSNTANLELPLVDAAQAQKHVTVNEALVRLDGLSQLVLASVSEATPPTVVVDGVCYGVPAGAVNAWAGRTGQIAIGTNGGWDFAVPKTGWRAFVRDAGQTAIHDGTGWRGGQVTLSPFGAGLGLSVVEFTHTLGAGAQSLTGLVIPANAVVFGVTGRVLTAITGTLASWQLGNPGFVGRYGSGLGLGAGSFAHGVLGQPTAFYAATALQLDATGGAFAGGSVRLAVHLLQLTVPGP